MYRSCFKRVLDIAASIAALIVLSPLMLATAVLVRARFGSPVLFRQTRPGLHGEPFTILKFRTMKVARHSSEGDESRLTTLGGWLRALSLDELPELINVLKGDMSLVGPRPLLTHYLQRYTPEQARRHEVRPGITGWAQVNGRNELSWDDKFRRDVWYIDNCSLALDLMILCRTGGALVTRRGITQPGFATAEEFRGPATL
jgi:lipopolysaccharide/colanic/teichoic acid biosynthesis glycosyltransferase